MEIDSRSAWKQYRGCSRRNVVNEEPVGIQRKDVPLAIHMEGGTNSPAVPRKISGQNERDERIFYPRVAQSTPQT